MFVYFVSYDFSINNHRSSGNTRAKFNGPIDSMDDIKLIEKQLIEDNGYDSAVVNNFIRLEGE